MSKLFARCMLFETLRANVLLYPQKKNESSLFFLTRKRERWLYTKVSYEKSKPFIFVENFPYRTSAEIRSVFDSLGYPFFLSSMDIFIFIFFSPAPHPFEVCLENVFLHVFARNSNQELMKASIAAGKNH